MSSVRFDLKFFLSSNPKATKEDLSKAVQTAPEVYFGVDQWDIVDYLLNNNDTESPRTKKQLIPLLPSIISYIADCSLDENGITCDDIDQAYYSVIHQEIAILN